MGGQDSDNVWGKTWKNLTQVEREAVKDLLGFSSMDEWDNVSQSLGGGWTKKWASFTATEVKAAKTLGFVRQRDWDEALKHGNAKAQGLGVFAKSWDQMTTEG